jgi:hypothetical protein
MGHCPCCLENPGVRLNAALNASMSSPSKPKAQMGLRYLRSDRDAEEEARSFDWLKVPPSLSSLGRVVKGSQVQVKINEIKRKVLVRDNGILR